MRSIDVLHLLMVNEPANSPRAGNASQRLVIVQFAGCYRETFLRRTAGGSETYFAQRYSDEFIASLVTPERDVVFLCEIGTQAHDERLPDGVRSINLGQGARVNRALVQRTLEALRPTHLLIRTPQDDLIRWANRHAIDMLVTIADSFEHRSLRSRLQSWRLARALNLLHVRWVSNHGVNACRSLARIGVDPRKIVPWDWPHDAQAARAASAKSSARKDEPILFYAGAVSPAKGVGDLLHAALSLKRAGRAFRLVIAGKDANDAMQREARAIGIDDHVDFLGLVPHSQIGQRMRDADLIVIPSRHAYPEGLPLTIYEALASRTPIVASDHPMFQGILVDGSSALVVQEADSAALAGAIERLFDDDGLYARLSANSADAYERIQIPVKWGDLVRAWLEGDASGTRWIADHSLALSYDDHGLIAADA